MAGRKLTRIHSLIERVGDTFSAHPNELIAIFSRFVKQGKGMLQPHQLLAEYEAVCSNGEIEKLTIFEDLLRAAQEALVTPPWVALAIRPRPDVWEYIRVNVSELAVEELSASEYLQYKEKLVDGRSEGNFVLELDFEPNNDFFLSPSMLESIGNGVTHLNGFLSSKLFQYKESWYPMIHFLQAHNHNGMSMMLNDKIQSLGALRSALRKAKEHLLSIPQDTPYSEFDLRFQELGLEKGWGDTAKRAGENIRLLLDLLEVPDLEKFLSTIPMMFTVVILSPNGCFDQANVLGYPGTGGQIVYTLDRVHPLEDEMLLRIKEQGLDIPPKILLVARFPPDAIETTTTTCGQPLEIVKANEQHTSIQLGPFLPPLAAAATALTLVDVLAAVFGLFGLGSTALQILNLAAFLLDIFLVHLTIAISGGCPLVRRRLGGEFSVSRAYNLAKLAVFLTGALALLLVVAEPHFESVRLSRC